MLEAGQELRFPGSSVSVGSSGTHTERVLARDVTFLLWQMRNTCPLCYSFVETFIRTSLVPRTGASPFLCSYLPKEEQQRERAPPSGHQHLLCTAHLSCELQSCLLFWEDGSGYTNTELFCLFSTQCHLLEKLGPRLFMPAIDDYAAIILTKARHGLKPFTCIKSFASHYRPRR